MNERPIETHVIPRIIHFIWAGGAKIMPVTGLTNVIAWAKANPDFAVKIWIDSKTDPECIAKYQDAFTSLGGMPPNIIFNDIAEPGKTISSDEIRYEIDHLCPNYGASSDMLRYNILFEEGGAYFDCMDVNPGRLVSLMQTQLPDEGVDANKSVFSTPLAEHHLLMHMTKHTAIRGVDEAPGTEAMVCTPGNPDMRRIAEQAKDAYHRNDRWTYKRLPVSQAPGSPGSPLSRAARGAHPSSSPRRLFELRSSGSDAEIIHRQESVEAQSAKGAELRGKETLAATGPNMVIDLLSQDHSSKISSKYLMPHDSRGEKDWVSLPKEHAGSWGALRIVPCTQEDAISKALNSIEFERQQMNFANIPMHVEQIVSSVTQHAKNNSLPSPESNALRSEVKRELETRLTNRPRDGGSPRLQL